MASGSLVLFNLGCIEVDVLTFHQICKATNKILYFIAFRDWSKSIGGGGGGPVQRGGGSSVFEPLVRGGSCSFYLPVGGGSPCFYYGN